MNLFLSKEDGKVMPLTVDDDFRVDELYCALNNIGSDVSDDEVHSLMLDSDDYLLARNGTAIRFSDYANSDVTLAQAGFNEGTEYRLEHNYASAGENGGGQLWTM